MKIFHFKKSIFLGLALFYNFTLIQANVKNPSFEKDKISGERQIVQKLSNWEITSGNVELITSKVFPSAEGNLVLDLNGDQPGSIKQTIKGLNKGVNYVFKLPMQIRSQEPAGPKVWQPLTYSSMEKR
jgi:hypothetical protein